MVTLVKGLIIIFNLVVLTILFAIPGSGFLFAWFFLDRQKFKLVLTGERTLPVYLSDLRSRYASGKK